MNKTYTVTLHGWAIVTGDVIVDAATPADALTAAKADWRRASWPIDQCGGNVPASEGVAASYIMEAGRDFEDWPEEDAPAPADPLRDAAPDLMAALIAAKQEMWLRARAQWTMADFKNWAIIQQIDAALEKADGKPRTAAAIAKAEGRANG